MKSQDFSLQYNALQCATSAVVKSHYAQQFLRLQCYSKQKQAGLLLNVLPPDNMGVQLVDLSTDHPQGFSSPQRAHHRGADLQGCRLRLREGRRRHTRLRTKKRRATANQVSKLKKDRGEIIFGIGFQLHITQNY